MGNSSEIGNNIPPERESTARANEEGRNCSLISFKNNNNRLKIMDTPNPVAMKTVIKGFDALTLNDRTIARNEHTDKRQFALPTNQQSMFESKIASEIQPHDEQLKSPLRRTDVVKCTDSSIQPVANIGVAQDKAIDVDAPLFFLNQAQEMEKHLEIREGEQRRNALSVKPEIRDSEGKSTIRTDSAKSLNRKINDNYLAALQAAAESEPARKQALAQIDQHIEDIKKELNLDHTPSRHELDEMKKPENLAKLTTSQRQSFEELEKLIENKETLESSSLKSAEKKYENFLERTNQTEALERFKQFKPILETLPFQDWLNKAGKSTAEQSTVREENNPFSAYRKAVEALHGNPPNVQRADFYFNAAIKTAEKLDPKTLEAEATRVKAELKAEKDKAQPDTITLARLEAEAKALVLLAASPGLMRIAYADFLINSGHSDQAFHQLVTAADNRAAEAMVNKNNQYFEQLMDRSLHGDKNMIAAANQAANYLEEFHDHFTRALSYTKSADKQKAQEEFEAAYKAAERARALTHNMDNRELAHNARLYDEAIKEEMRKPAKKQNQEKLKTLEEQRKIYQKLAHLPALASFAQAQAEFTVSTINGKANINRETAVRSLIAEAEADPTLRNIPEIGQQIDRLKELVHEQSLGGWAWDSLRRNSGTIAALSVGFAVAGLTCWSGPGAALAGAAAAGAVAGSLTDWTVGNEVNFESFGGHAFESAGGGVGRVVLGRVAGSMAISRIPLPLVRHAITGAATAGSTSSVQYIPDMVHHGPSTYIPRVGLNATIGLALGPATRFAGNRIPSLSPFFQSPGVSHAVKTPFTESLFGTGSEISLRSAYILNMP